MAQHCRVTQWRLIRKLSTQSMPNPRRGMRTCPHTKELDSSPEDEAEPAVKAAPPVAAPSDQDVAEPSPATRAPGVPDTPGSLEAS
eukprot:6083230-Pyramimonas_sp.AAC.1